MILNDVYTELARRCSLDVSNSTDLARMLSSVNNQLQRLFLTTNLESERENFSLTTVSGQSLYRLDSRVLRSINFRETTSPNKLDFMARKDFEKQHPNITVTDDSGLPDTYVPMRKVRVTTQPTAASTISIVSSSVADITTYYVVVKGYNAAGTLLTERLLLTGAVAVVTSNTYSSLLSISKDTTNGTITATSNAGVVTNISLLPGEKQKEHWEILLYKIPDAAYTIPYTAQVVPWNLSYAEDALPLPSEMIENFLASVTSELLFIQGDQKYLTWDAKNEKLSQEIKDMSFVGEDDDLRFGYEDISYPGDFT
jgi:hypothetical protein